MDTYRYVWGPRELRGRQVQVITDLHTGVQIYAMSELGRAWLEMSLPPLSSGAKSILADFATQEEAEEALEWLASRLDAVWVGKWPDLTSSISGPTATSHDH